MEFRGQDLLTKRSSELRKLWGKYLSYVPQDVASALNPSRPRWLSIGRGVETPHNATGGRTEKPDFGRA